MSDTPATNPADHEDEAELDGDAVAAESSWDGETESLAEDSAIPGDEELGAEGTGSAASAVDSGEPVAEVDASTAPGPLPNAENSEFADSDNAGSPAFVSWGHEQAPVVLALHDIGYDLRMWYPLGDRLAESYRLIAVDLPGHGIEPPAGVPWTVEEAAESAREILADLGVEIAAVVGCGLGARIAVELAIQQPGMVAALVLADPSAPVGEPGDERILALRGPRDLGKRRAVEITDGFLAGGLRRRYERLSHEGMFEALDAFTSAAPLDEALAHQVQCPALVCASASSAATEARRLVRDLPSGRLVLFRDAGAVVAHSRPEDFADQVFRFLRAVEEGEQVRGERTI